MYAGAGCLLTLLATRSTDPGGTGPLLTRLSEMSELLTLKLEVNDVLLTRIEGRTGGIEAVVLVKGDVTIGIDLSAARLDAIDQVHRSAVLVLPAPFASRPRVDHEHTRIYSISRDGLWLIAPTARPEPAITEKVMAEAQQLVARASASPEIDANARRRAELLLRTSARLIGWDLRVEWADRKPAAV
jgi:hypothetical protein